ncbi:hypothetical protein ID854_21485 [Xenorhabdus sp. M]|uniref:Uncharacterized protein n=1 Tax=Xenorhabdus szentirmaii TaxID=290112 RepID=A0AAW3YZX7_9GAMM|nr:hypothetical protein [Xenorhabdus sp. M]MBD2802947.1 hypothetical protein [Xenorhabdus sp. M]
MVHLRTFGSRYRQSDDDEGCLILSIMASRPSTQRGTRFPLGRCSSFFYLGEYHATKYTPDHSAYGARV